MCFKMHVVQKFVNLSVCLKGLFQFFTSILINTEKVSRTRYKILDMRTVVCVCLELMSWSEELELEVFKMDSFWLYYSCHVHDCAYYF